MVSVRGWSGGARSEPAWNWERCDYRVKEGDYTLDIPWELIQEDWKWAVMDGEGVVWLTEKEPRINSQYNIWLPNRGVVKFFLKINTPDIKHWDKTLTKRPEGV